MQGWSIFQRDHNIEYQERYSPDDHLFIWIFNASDIQNETNLLVYWANNKYTVTKWFEWSGDFLVNKTYQVHARCRTCRNVASPMVNILCRRKLFQNHFFVSLAKMKNKRWRNRLLKQVKSYICNNLNIAKVNVIDPTKDHFSRPLSIFYWRILQPW